MECKQLFLHTRPKGTLLQSPPANEGIGGREEAERLPAEQPCPGAMADDDLEECSTDARPRKQLEDGGPQQQRSPRAESDPPLLEVEAQAEKVCVLVADLEVVHWEAHLLQGVGDPPRAVHG